MAKSTPYVWGKVIEWDGGKGGRGKEFSGKYLGVSPSNRIKPPSMSDKR